VQQEEGDEERVARELDPREQRPALWNQPVERETAHERPEDRRDVQQRGDAGRAEEDHGDEEELEVALLAEISEEPPGDRRDDDPDAADQRDQRDDLFYHDEGSESALGGAADQRKDQQGQRVSKQDAAEDRGHRPVPSDIVLVDDRVRQQRMRGEDRRQKQCGE